MLEVDTFWSMHFLISGHELGRRHGMSHPVACRALRDYLAYDSARTKTERQIAKHRLENHSPRIRLAILRALADVEQAWKDYQETEDHLTDLEVAAGTMSCMMGAAEDLAWSLVEQDDGEVTKYTQLLKDQAERFRIAEAKLTPEHAVELEKYYDSNRWRMP